MSTGKVVYAKGSPVLQITTMKYYKQDKNNYCGAATAKQTVMTVGKKSGPNMPSAQKDIQAQLGAVTVIKYVNKH